MINNIGTVKLENKIKEVNEPKINKKENEENPMIDLIKNLIYLPHISTLVFQSIILI